MDQPTLLSPYALDAEVTPSPFQAALRRVAGGDPAIAAGLLGLAWDAYVVAGLPHGPDKEGMAEWWRGLIEAAFAGVEGPDDGVCLVPPGRGAHPRDDA